MLEIVINHREHIDKPVNSHGKALLDFLLTSDMCVLNGRSGPAGNQYTDGITLHGTTKLCNRFERSRAI